MADLNKVRSIMPLERAMQMYCTTDKEKFECAYPEMESERPDSTFFADFCVACVYGEKAIQDTYNRAFNGWKSNVKMFTELTGVLNHQLWFWYEHGIEEYSRMFDKLWKEADAYGCDHFKGEELKHFMMVLDQLNLICYHLRLLVHQCQQPFFINEVNHVTQCPYMVD